jgi:aminotransferase
MSAEAGIPERKRNERGLPVHVKEIGVAVVPGSSFYQDPTKGRTQIRFAFSKKAETFDEAERRLAKLKPRA